MNNNELRVVIKHAATMRKLKSKSDKNFIFSRICELMANHDRKKYRELALVKTREHDYSIIRMAVCHIIVSLFDFTLRDAAILTGLREDHSTVIRHIKCHYDRYDRLGYEDYKEEYDRFMEFVSDNWDFITAEPGEFEVIKYTPNGVLRNYVARNESVTI